MKYYTFYTSTDWIKHIMPHPSRNNEHQKPTVDVVIPVYNGGVFIEKCLESIFRQTYQPQHIIIVNDGSTDDTEAKIVALAARQPSIKYIAISNGGQAKARNVGIKNSTADLIAFLDADDLWDSEKMDEQVKLFVQKSDAGIIYCLCRTIPTRKIWSKPLNGVVDQATFLINHDTIKNPSVVMVPRSILLEMNGFDETLRGPEDTDLFLRIMKKYPVYGTGTVRATYVTHTGNFTSRKDANFYYLPFIKKWSAIIVSSKSLYAYYRFSILQYLFHDNQNVPRSYKHLSEILGGDLVREFKVKHIFSARLSYLIRKQVRTLRTYILERDLFPALRRIRRRLIGKSDRRFVRGKIANLLL